MKFPLLISLLLLTTPLLAPVTGFVMIGEGERVARYDPIVTSFMFVESGFRKDTVNSLNAGGILQIRPEMIQEANRILKLKGRALKYILDDRLDSAKSVNIWYTVQNYWNPRYELKRAARIWNPKADERYYQRIRKYMQQLKNPQYEK